MRGITDIDDKERNYNNEDATNRDRPTSDKLLKLKTHIIFSNQKHVDKCNSLYKKYIIYI